MKELNRRLPGELGDVIMKIVIQLGGGLVLVRHAAKQGGKLAELLVRGGVDNVLHGPALHHFPEFQQIAIGGLAELPGQGARKIIAHDGLDKRAALWRTADVAARLQNGERLAQDSPAYAQLIGQLAFGRQARADGKLSAAHGMGELFGNAV